ncbi:hypothetical protein DA11_07715 [Aeromonas caviae]|nr:hypothetical protein DA11_07715 [Aeromonas caviae]
MLGLIEGEIGALEQGIHPLPALADARARLTVNLTPSPETSSSVAHLICSASARALSPVMRQPDGNSSPQGVHHPIQWAELAQQGAEFTQYVVANRVAMSDR